MYVFTFRITLSFSGRLPAMLNDTFGGGSWEGMRVDIGGRDTSVSEVQVDVEHSTFNNCFGVWSVNKMTNNASIYEECYSAKSGVAGSGGIIYVAMFLESLTQGFPVWVFPMRLLNSHYVVLCDKVVQGSFYTLSPFVGHAFRSEHPPRVPSYNTYFLYI